MQPSLSKIKSVLNDPALLEVSDFSFWSIVCYTLDMDQKSLLKVIKDNHKYFDYINLPEI